MPQHFRSVASAWTLKNIQVLCCFCLTDFSTITKLKKEWKQCRVQLRNDFQNYFCMWPAKTVDSVEMKAGSSLTLCEFSSTWRADCERAEVARALDNTDIDWNVAESCFTWINPERKFQLPNDSSKTRTENGLCSLIWSEAQTGATFVFSVHGLGHSAKIYCSWKWSANGLPCSPNPALCQLWSSRRWFF